MRGQPLNAEYGPGTEIVFDEVAMEAARESDDERL
jgi:hypothetical protein